MCIKIEVLLLFLITLNLCQVWTREDDFVDKWGVTIDWNNALDGWDEEKRKTLQLLAKLNDHQPKVVPAFTELGFLKMAIPESLYEFILSQKLHYQTSVEPCYDTAHLNCNRLLPNGTKVPKKNVLLVQVRDPRVFHDVIVAEMDPILESWSGISLESSAVYGIRRYLNGSYLNLHVDRLNTHVISAILQIDQDVREPWPLLLIDLQGNRRRILLNPGEMLLYESAKVPHGRQFPLNGLFYDNLFVHFRPQKPWYEEEMIGDESLIPPDRLITKKDLL